MSRTDSVGIDIESPIHATHDSSSGLTVGLLDNAVGPVEVHEVRIEVQPLPVPYRIARSNSDPTWQRTLQNPFH